MAYKGKFKPHYPDKYRGDYNNIVYRSLWELRFMRYLDTNPAILEWASEEIVIPYYSPVDKKMHRYFPDFWIKAKVNETTINTMIIEIKPDIQTRMPERKQKTTRRYISELKTFGVNDAKWKAAEQFCLDRKWQFKVLTEKELGLGKV
jgi:myo-inositol catabolism protein IolC